MVETGTLVRWIPDDDLGVVLGYDDAAGREKHDSPYYIIWFVNSKIDNSVYVGHPNLEIINESR